MSFIHKVCERLGENNKPIYTVLAIACGKGTVRPILSITDKKEAPDARKYAALRELLTEFIGVPTTLGFGLLAESCTGFLAKKGTKNFKSCNASLSFLGICMAAGYFVPKFCNLAMPPIMKKLMPSYNPDGKQPVKKPTFSENLNKPANNNLAKTQITRVNSPYYHTGMRV